MKENFKMLGQWWKFTRPNKLYFILSFMSGLGFRILFYVVQPIFAARIITSLTVANYKGALINLALGTAIFIMAYCVHHIKYLMHDKLLRTTYIPFQEMICKKIFIAEDVNFKNNSKDRLLNISYQDAWDTANFADTLTTRIGQFGQVLVIFVTIAIINPYVALIILAATVINSFVLSFLQTKYAQGTKKIREGVDNSYHTMTAMLESREHLHSEKEKKEIQEKHIKANTGMLDEFRKRQTWSSANDNGYGIWCKVFIFLLTMFMILLVEKDRLSLEMYLIVVPYFTTIIDASNEVLSVFRDLKNAVVSMNRLQVIEGFSERDVIKFGNNSVDDILGQIDFINIDYNPEKTKLNNLTDINFHVRENETTIILGEKNCGKRSIFRLLMRDIKQSRGDIFVGGMKIDQYSDRSYFKNIAYTTSKPYFQGETILQNLKRGSTKREEILQLCSDFGLDEVIENLPNKEMSGVEELSSTDKFLLDVARCVLSKANIVAIYELPSVDEKNKKRIFDALSKVHGMKTFIIFSGQEEFAELGDKVVTIEKGEVKNIQFTDKGEK